jgi:two-component system sensor histidine kinase YesM
MIKPINRLVKAMKKLNINNISDSFMRLTAGRLGFLHKTFNNMAKEIDHLVTWITENRLPQRG